MQKTFIGISALVLFLLACGGLSFVVPPTPPATPTPTPSPFPSTTASATFTFTPSATETRTPAPSETPTPTFTYTPTLPLEPQSVIQGPGDIIVPILLYHHIGFSLKDEQVYYISPETFDQQMNLLYQWGYKTISVQLLAKAINEGAELPARPILLTFDDGSETTYSTALPLMQRYGFTGVSYIVYYYIGLTHYMSADQIRALYAAGWEIGSHGLSHRDLTVHPERQENEIVQSRRQFEDLLGFPVLSFAYPFGAYDESSLGYVHFAGYIAAMGLGNETVQGNKNLFYLSRQAVKGTDELQTFAARLPWREDHIDLPPLTIVP